MLTQNQEPKQFVLASVAGGSCSPGAWERGMLEQIGLITDSNEHEQYRAHYGPVPSSAAGGSELGR